jgi:hypothetical protein
MAGVPADGPPEAAVGYAFAIAADVVDPAGERERCQQRAGRVGDVDGGAGRLDTGASCPVPGPSRSPRRRTSPSCSSDRIRLAKRSTASTPCVACATAAGSNRSSWSLVGVSSSCPATGASGLSARPRTPVPPAVASHAASTKRGPRLPRAGRRRCDCQPGVTAVPPRRARRDGGAAAPADSQSIVAVLELTADSPGGVFGNAGMHDRGQHHLPDDRHRRQGLAIVPDDSATVTLSCSVAPSCDLKTTPSVGSGPLMSTVTVR